jgi:hypothetical protein
MRSKYRVIRERNRKIPRKYKENGDRKYRGDMKRAGIDTGRSRDDTGKVEDKQKDRSDRSREDKIRFRELRGDTGWKIQGIDAGMSTDKSGGDTRRSGMGDLGWEIWDERS